LPNKPWPARLRGRSLVATCLAAVTMLFIAASFSISKLDEQIIRNAGPDEGYYWTVAQYELAYLRVREAAEILARNGEIDDEELSTRVAVLMSKKSILTGDSELTAFFKRISGFEVSTQKIAVFHRRVDPMLDAPDDVRLHARHLVRAFADVEDTILTLANEVRLEELSARHSTMESLLTRRQLLWFALWIGFGVMLLWVLSMSLSWSRYLRAAKAREQALEAEHRAVQAKTLFLGMVSHELRSPLQSIVSALDVLESRHALPDRAEVTRRIRRSANELSVQLRDMLTLARGQEGRIELRPEAFDACELVREITEDAVVNANAKGLALEVSTPSTPLFVVADGARIGQLLHNLVSNAIKYTDHGEVVVTLHDFDNAAAALRFRIADSGPGLPATAAGTVFEGLEATPPQSFERCGLGLAVVHALLRQLDGTVKVLQTGGAGTTFDLSIPAVPVEERPPAYGSGEERILIVDDRPELLTSFAQVCTDLELICDTASSAAVALNLLTAHAYGAVLIDLDMPGRTGAELAAEVKASRLNNRARLVAMTAGGHGSSEDDLSVFDAVLEKPILRLQISTVMSQQGNRRARPK
jgi:signal transduction histidine kinase